MAIMTSQIPMLLESAYNARDEVVLCLLGKPGIGKTQQLYQFAEKKGCKVVEIIASQILPNEVSGITMPVEESHSMEIFDHARLSSLKDGDILFFDELLQASPQTLSACLTLIQERRLMSGKKLPDIMIVAAANELASATMIPMQIRQRFLFVYIGWDSTAWSKYISKQYGIEVPTSIIRMINFNDKNYNTLTPRTMSKLIDWHAKVRKDERLVETWSDVVATTFGSNVATGIFEMFTKVSPNRQILEALTEAGISNDGDMADLVGNWYDLSLPEIMKRLQAMDNWSEIEKVLSSTELRR